MNTQPRPSWLARAVLIFAAGLMLPIITARGDAPKGSARQRLLAQRAAAPPASERPLRRVGKEPTEGKKARFPETVVVRTGSNLPSNARKWLQITDGNRNLIVLDRQQLERSGAASLGEAVRRFVR